MYACKFVIGLSIYIKSRKGCRVPSLSHQRFSDDRGGKLNFSTAHRHHFCLSVSKHCLNTVALIFSIVTLLVVIVIVISKFPKCYSKAKRTKAPDYSRALRRIKGGFPKGVKRSSGPISRIPGWDRVAVKVGVVQV